MQAVWVHAESQQTEPRPIDCDLLRRRLQRQTVEALQTAAGHPAAAMQTARVYRIGKALPLAPVVKHWPA